MRKEHQWMSAKVPSLEADSFFIKINCVAGAAYLSMPPADTCPPPTALLRAYVCVCSSLCARVHLLCVYSCVCSNAIKQWQCYQTLPKAYERIRGEYRPKISMFPREQRVSTVSQNIRKESCSLDLFSPMKCHSFIAVVVKPCVISAEKHCHVKVTTMLTN